MTKVEMPEELQHLMLQMLFRGAKGPPQLFAALSTKPPGRNALEDAAKTEVAVQGYSRQPVTLESCTVTRQPCTVSTDELVFRNFGTSQWPVVRSFFIGTDHGEGSVLVAWLPLDHTRTVFPNDLLKVTVNLGFGGADANAV